MPRGATVVSPCPLCSGGQESSSFHNAIWAFLEQSQRESLLAKPLLSFDLLVLITCTSSCHNVGVFYCPGWKCREVLYLLSNATVVSVYKRAQNCFYQMPFFCHCFLVTDTTLNLHRDNTLKWEISIPINCWYVDKS